MCARLKHLLACLVLLGCAPAHTFAASLATEWIYQYVLATSERGDELLYVMVDFEKDATLREPPMLDLLTEVICFNVDNLPFSQADLFRMVKIVVKTDDARYSRAFDKVARATTSSGPYAGDRAEWREEINRLAGDFAKRHAATKVSQYAPGSIDIGAMRNNYVTAAKDRQHTTEQVQKLLALAPGAPFDEVFAIAGAPELVDIANESSTYRGQRMRNRDQMQLHYRGLGRVTFFYERKTSWRLARVVAEAEHPQQDGMQ